MALIYNPETGRLEDDGNTPGSMSDANMGLGGAIGGSDDSPLVTGGAIGGGAGSPLAPPIAPPGMQPFPAPPAAAVGNPSATVGPTVSFDTPPGVQPFPAPPAAAISNPPAPAAAPADPGATTAPAGTTSQFLDTNDYWRGVSADGTRIDPATLAAITDPGQLSYYTNDASLGGGQTKGYERELFRRYGALNNLGDTFRNYLQNQMGRVQSGFELAQAIPAGAEGSSYFQDDFLGYLRQGLENGSVFDPRAYGAGLSTLLDYVDRARAGEGEQTPGSEFLQGYASDPETARDQLYRWGLLTLGNASPLYGWASQTANRNRLLGQMPASETYANWVRRLFGVQAGQELEPLNYRYGGG